jgi:hypothetical protein
VEDFEDFLHGRQDDQRLTSAAVRVSEPAFTAVWGNPDDIAYERL